MINNTTNNTTTNNTIGLVNVGDVTVGDINTLQNVAVLNNIAPSLDILTNTLQNGVLNGGVVGGDLLGSVEVGNVLSGSITALNQVLDTDVLNNALNGELLTGGNAILSNIVSDNGVAAVVGDVLSANTATALVSDLVTTNVVGGDALNGLLSNNALDIVEDVANIDGNTLGQVVGDIGAGAVVADFLNADVVTGLLSGNVDSDILDIDAATAVTQIVGNGLDTSVVPTVEDLADIGNLVTAATSVTGLASFDGLLSNLVGDDVLGGVLATNDIGADITATVDSVLDQLVASTNLFDIGGVDAIHDVIS